MRFLPISVAASIYLFKPPYAIGSVPSISGHASLYQQWRSLPRVRRHRAGKPQGSSKRVLLTMNQLMYAPLSHIHYYILLLVLYEVAVLKVPVGVA